MNSKKIIVGLMLFSSLAVASCGGKKKLVIKSLDLKDAKSFFVGTAKPNQNIKRANDVTEGENVLYKITSSGESVAVEATLSNGDIVKQYENPTFFTKMNDKYFLIEFDEKEMYIVDDETGNAFSFNTENYPDLYILKETKHFDSDRIFQIDKNGNIYFHGRNQSNTSDTIQKLDVSDPNNLSITTVSATGDSLDAYDFGFAVDFEGNVAYSGRDASGNYVTRYVTADKKVFNIGGADVGHTYFWRNNNGEIFTEIAGKIAVVDFDKDAEGALTGAKLITISSDTFEIYSNNFYDFHSLKGSINQTYYLSNQPFSDLKIYQVTGEDDELGPVLDLKEHGMSQIRSVSEGVNTLVVAGLNEASQPMILQYYPANAGQDNEVLKRDLSRIEFSSIAVLGDNIISYSGLSLDENATVVGLYDLSNGTDYRSSTTFAGDVSFLTRM